MGGIVIDSISGDVHGGPPAAPAAESGGGGGGGQPETPEKDAEEMLMKLQMLERRRARLRAD